MLSRRSGLALVIVGGMTAMAAVFAVSQLPVIGAGGLLHPARAKRLIVSAQRRAQWISAFGGLAGDRTLDR